MRDYCSLLIDGVDSIVSSKGKQYCIYIHIAPFGNFRQMFGDRALDTYFCNIDMFWQGY